VWIEIIATTAAAFAITCHSLYGECGLKSLYTNIDRPKSTSLSVWRVWIEMINAGSAVVMPSVTLCMESVD